MILSERATDRLLASKCEHCGKTGRGLSTCKHCGEFIPMTLSMDIVVKQPQKRAKSRMNTGARQRVLRGG